MNIKVLNSGSSGNGYIIQNETEALIIECGVQYKEAVNALNGNVSKVCGCLVTHSHGDHAKYISKYAKPFNIFATEGTFEECKIKPNTFHYKVIELFKEFKVGNFVVKAFDTVHDTNAPCGFIIFHKDMGTMLFLTDTHHVKYRFAMPFDCILIECNHNNQLVDESVKKGIIPRSVGVRAKATHMSIERCIDCLRACNLQKTKFIVLIHISENNGDKLYFQGKIAEKTGKPTYIAQKGLTLELL